MNRRNFLRLTAASAAVAAVAPAALFAPSPEKMKVLVLGEKSLEMREIMLTDFGVIEATSKTVWSRNLWDERVAKRSVYPPRRFT